MMPAPHASDGQHPGDPRPATINRRSSTCQPCRVYPWLLVLSTAIAATFCLLYITKPVILSPLPPLQNLPAGPPPTRTPSPTTTARPALLPNASHLPGELLTTPARGPSDDSPRAPTSPPATPAFEETNLRIQHILTAQAPTGPLARIDLDVPVLYQSRSLRWTPADIAEARNLLIRLMDYQEKSQRLRAEGGDLLDSWNHLLSRSLPATDLRADSPSLPANQEEAAATPRPPSLNTTESIQILPAGK